MSGNPLLDLPVSSNPLLDIPPPPKPKASTGFLGTVGDWIMDNTIGGVSAEMLDNAKSGVFSKDAANDQGFFDRAGSLLERGGAAVDAGIYEFLGGLGSEKARAAAATLKAGTTGSDVAGSTSWENVNGLGSLSSYVVDAGIESVPAMAALATPYVGVPLLAASQTGSIASERAANNNTGDVTGSDLLTAVPAALLSTALDRFSLKGIKNPAGNTIKGRIAGAAAREGMTEAAQSGIEYGGGTIGTEAGFDAVTALDRMLAGGVAGAPMGAASRGAMEPVDAFNARRASQQPQSGALDDSDWEGSLDDLLPPEQKDNPLLALPAPSVYVNAAGNAAVGSAGPDAIAKWLEAERLKANNPQRDSAAVAPKTPQSSGDPVADFMRKARGAESGGNDAAKNPLSSATGRYQFIESTWLATYRQEFGKTGETDAQILAKRGDGKLQDRLMRRLTDDSASSLRSAGVPVDVGNLYLAHFAGPGGAIKLHRNPAASAESVLGKSVIKANPFLKGMTAGDVIAWAAKKMGGKAGYSSSSNPDTPFPDFEIPGADGLLLNRGDQERIANLDIPQAAGQDWRLPDSEVSNVPAAPNQAAPQQSAQPLPSLPDLPPTRQGDVSQVIAPRVGPVDTQFELRDMSELIDSASPGYDPSLQPRDRAGRAASGAQVASIAGALDPRQLGDSRLASTGAPIIGPDGQVESGNGRIAALRQVYAQFPEQAQAYRQMITERGLDATGLQFPVLVRRRTTEMTPAQRQDWTRAANERDTMAMSSTEQASADARSLPDKTLSIYRGGPVTAAANRDFVRAFIERAVAPAERNAMIAPDGSLSVDGARRIRFALLARAYGDSELIGRIAEDTDTNIAAIGKALLEAAPAMAKLKAAIDAGEIPPQYDISKNIAEASRMVARSRDTGQSLKGMLAQTDAFADKISPETEQVLNLFYRDGELKHPRSAVKIADDLISYAQMAEEQAANAAQGNDMFGNAPTLDSPAMLLQRVRSGDDGDQIDLLAPQPEKAYAAPDEQGDRYSGQPAAATATAGDKPDDGPRSPVSVLARGQLRALGIAAQLRTEKAAALVGRTARTPRELAEIAQVYRDPRYETFRIFLTKGDTIVHATGVSSRSVNEAPLMPKDMDQEAFYASVKQAMADTEADGYYLLHNHPSGDPTPSKQDRDTTFFIAKNVPGMRAHVVINSNKYAQIQITDGKQISVGLRNISTGEDQLIKASTPHALLGRQMNKAGELVALGKELQKSGWITVIGTASKGEVRVIVDYPASTLQKDVRSLMAMARRVQRQSGSASLFLVGDRAVLDRPVVHRAMSGGMVTAAIDENGKEIASKKANARNRMPRSPARYVAEDIKQISDQQAEQILNDARVSRGLSVADGKPVFRGESEATGSGMAVYGLGQYTTTNKSTAQKFGKIREVGKYELPDNPIRFADKQAFDLWLQNALFKTLGYKNKLDFGKDYSDFADFIRALDPSIDGVQIGSKSDAIFVSYPIDVVKEEATTFQRGTDPRQKIASGLVDSDGISRDVQKIRDVIGNPVETLKGVARSGLADNARAIFYTMDSRMRAYAKRYNSASITALANHFHAQAGTGGGAVTETYHEAHEREGLGRAGQAWRILEPFIGDKAAMERITRMLRLPAERARGRRAEGEAAAKIAKLLKDTLEYRREAGEDIGEVTTGYFPRMLDVEKVVKQRETFLRNATELFKRHDAANPRASAEAWLARTFDQYAGVDGGLDLTDLFHDKRPAGVGRSTTKPRKFGEDADKLLGDFYQNDTGQVLTAYFIGGARKAEEMRRFGNDKLKQLFDQIQDDIRKSGEDGGDVIGALARMVATNLGRTETPSERVRATTSFLHTAGQLGTLDRATITSLSEAMMGFVRGGARYGLPMVIRSAREFARQVRKAPPSEAARMTEALGIAQDAIIGEALAARSGFERGQTTRRAQKVQQGFFKATGLEQWTTGTRTAATAMGQQFIRDLAMDMGTGKAKRATEYLNELGIADPKGFSKWLLDGGNPTPEELLGQGASANARAYRGALVRFVNQTIMKPTRAEKPKWASHPVGGLFFSLMSYSYGFKKNVLDRTGRMIVRGVKEGDPTLLYPAFGMAALFATHTVVNNVLRQAIFGGGREDDEEGITFLDWVEALDRAGLFGAASPLLNAAWGLKYRRGTMESLVGPVIGRPFELADKTVGLATSGNSPKTNTAERAAAAALYDVVLEPAMEAYGVTRLKGAAAAGVVWGSGNREGGVVPPDRDIFVEAVAGPKEAK